MEWYCHITKNHFSWWPKQRFSSQPCLWCNRLQFVLIQYMLSFFFSQWDLVCDKSFYPMLTMTFFFIGVFCGGLTSGYLSDRFGRRPTLLVFLLLSIVFSFGSIFSPDYYTYTTIRFVSGIFFCVSWFVFLMCRPPLMVDQMKRYWHAWQYCLRYDRHFQDFSRQNQPIMTSSVFSETIKVLTLFKTLVWDTGIQKYWTPK